MTRYKSLRPARRKFTGIVTAHRVALREVQTDSDICDPLGETKKDGIGE